MVILYAPAGGYVPQLECGSYGNGITFIILYYIENKKSLRKVIILEQAFGN